MWLLFGSQLDPKLAVPPISVCVFLANLTSHRSCNLFFSVPFELLLELLMSAQLVWQVADQLQHVNSSCQLSCNGILSCQLRCNLSAQLHFVSCVNPLPSLNSILPPKMWAVFLVATNQTRVHAVTVHCIHSMTRALPKQPHVYPAWATPWFCKVYQWSLDDEQKCPLQHYARVGGGHHIASSPAAVVGPVLSAWLLSVSSAACSKRLSQRPSCGRSADWVALRHTAPGSLKRQLCPLKSPVIPLGDCRWTLVGDTY